MPPLSRVNQYTVTVHQVIGLQDLAFSALSP